MNLVHADVRHLAVLQDDSPRVNDATVVGVVLGPLFFVFLCDFSESQAAVGHSIGKNESRLLPLFQPGPHRVPLRFSIRDRHFPELRLDRLRMMKFADARVARNNAESKWFGEIHPKNVGIVVRVAMHGMRQHPHFVNAIGVDAFREALQPGIATFVIHRVRNFVNAEVTIVVDVLVRKAELLPLVKVVFELPLFYLRLFSLAQCFLDHEISSLEIVIEQETGSDQNVTKRVDVLGGLVAGKAARRAKRINAAGEKIFQSVEILALIQSAEDSLSTRAFESFRDVSNFGSQRGNNGRSLFGSWLVRFWRRHLFEIKLIDDFLNCDEFFEIIDRKRQLIETPLALLGEIVMTLEAVIRKKIGRCVTAPTRSRNK